LRAPGEMALRARAKELTPGVVARHGWRDTRYPGDDACDRCKGWGTMPTEKRIDGWVTFRTCAQCLGKGWQRDAPSPTKGTTE
jgi:DnaJ-class molecular chaperone